MKSLLFVAGALWAGNLHAQTAAGSISSSVAPAPRAPAPPEASPSCELHIFPTNEIINSSPDYFGQAGIMGAVVGSALTAAQSSGSGKLRVSALEQMQTYFTPGTQIRELTAAGVLSTLKLPPDTKIVEEAVLPAPYGAPQEPSLKQAFRDYWKAVKNGTPIRPSSAPCYRELIIASISISKGLGSLKFSASFVYRIFDDQHAEIHSFDGENSVPRPEAFPARTGDTDAVSAADAGLRTAFVANFSEWVARRVKF